MQQSSAIPGRLSSVTTEQIQNAFVGVQLCVSVGASNLQEPRNIGPELDSI